MPLKPLMKSFSFEWQNHDSWSETYIGVWRLVYEILPNSRDEQVPQDSGLCQLALVGSNHMMEVALGNLLRPFVGNGLGISSGEFRKANYSTCLKDFVPQVTGRSVDLEVEPFLSTEALRKRRNEVIHKDAKFANVNMARSALVTALKGARALFAHFDKELPYQHIISRYPVQPAEPFREILPS